MYWQRIWDFSLWYQSLRRRHLTRVNWKLSQPHELVPPLLSSRVLFYPSLLKWLSRGLRRVRMQGQLPNSFPFLRNLTVLYYFFLLRQRAEVGEGSLKLAFLEASSTMLSLDHSQTYPLCAFPSICTLPFCNNQTLRSTNPLASSYLGGNLFTGTIPSYLSTLLIRGLSASTLLG